MASTLTISKIEVGVQYSLKNVGGDVSGSFVYGNAGNNVTYKTSLSLFDTETGPVWLRGSNQYEDLNMGSIAIGPDPEKISGLGVSAFMTKRTWYSNKQTYFDGSKFTSDSSINIKIDADSSTSKVNGPIDYFPYVDITFTVSDGSLGLATDNIVQIEYNNDSTDTKYTATKASGTANYYDIEHAYFLNTSDNLVKINNSNTSLNENSFICTYDSVGSNSTNWFKYNASSGYYGNDVGNIFGILMNENPTLDNIPGNTAAYGYTNSYTSISNTSDSFQVIGNITYNTSDETPTIKSVVVRCFVGKNYSTIQLPAPSYTEEAHYDSKFYIALASNNTYTNTTRVNAIPVNVIFYREKLDVETKLKYNVRLNDDVISSFKQVKLRNVNASSASSFSIKNITDDIYLNYSMSTDEKETKYYLTDSPYGKIIMAIYKDNNDTIKDSSIYEYYLYTKLSTSDLTSLSSVKDILFPKISVNVSNAAEFKKDSIKITYYYTLDAVSKLTESPSSLMDKNVVYANNALYAFPLTSMGMISNSNCFLNILNDLSKEGWWYDMYTEYPNLSYSVDSSTAEHSFLDVLSDTYTISYNQALSNLLTELKTAVTNNTNILYTVFPTLLNISYTTKANDKYSIWYLIKTIVDFRDVRSNLTLDSKLLKNSDFLRNGYWKHFVTASKTDSSLKNFGLDNIADPNIEDKIMSPIDIINRDLYMFGTEDSRVKTIDSSTENIPTNINDFITYIDMYNVTNAGRAADTIVANSKYFGNPHEGILAEADDNGFLLNQDELIYFEDLDSPASALLRSIFDTDCSAYSYDLLTTALKDNPETTLGNKGFGAAAVGLVNNLNESSSTEILLSPLHKYEDIFLTGADITEGNFICVTNEDVLQSSTIISVK